jgi:hypothetical protein
MWHDNKQAKKKEEKKRNEQTHPTTTKDNLPAGVQA